MHLFPARFAGLMAVMCSLPSRSAIVPWTRAELALLQVRGVRPVQLDPLSSWTARVCPAGPIGPSAGRAEAGGASAAVHRPDVLDDAILTMPFSMSEEQDRPRLGDGDMFQEVDRQNNLYEPPGSSRQSGGVNPPARLIVVIHARLTSRWLYAGGPFGRLGQLLARPEPCGSTIRQTTSPRSASRSDGMSPDPSISNTGHKFIIKYYKT
jgi:hypothetical protein